MVMLFMMIFLPSEFLSSQTVTVASPAEGKNYFVNGDFSEADPAENWHVHRVFSVTNEESYTDSGHCLKIIGPEQWDRLDYKIDTQPQNGVPIDPAPDVVYTFSFKHKGAKNGRFDLLADKWIGDLYVEEDADWKEYSIDIATHSREYFYFQILSNEKVDVPSYFDDFKIMVKPGTTGVLEPKPTGVLRTLEGKYRDIQIGTNLWKMAWGGDKAFKDGVNWATAYDQPNHGDIWNPVFLEDLKPFAYLRAIDWAGVNHVESTYKGVTVLHWDKHRRKPTDNHRDLEIVAYEWMIDLCNKTGKDMWLTVPDMADDEYLEKLAELVKDKLNPELKLYIEWSNEVWNWGFMQQDRAEERGKQRGYSNPAAMDYVERSFNLFHIFDKVYGEDEMRKRVYRVCAFSGDIAVFADGYRKVVDDPKINVHLQKADRMAVAPYIGHGLDGYDCNIIGKFHRFTDQMIMGYIEPAYKIAKEFGCILITYEGGQHLTTGAGMISRNQELYDEYLYMLNRMARYFESFTHYALCGEWGDENAWGALRYTGQDPAEAPKYRALRDWINAPVIPDPGENIPVGQLVNPHFENGIDGWKCFLAPGTFEVVAGVPGRDHCLKIRNVHQENDNKMIFQRIRLIPGHKYMLCFDKIIPEAEREHFCSVQVFDPNTLTLIREHSWGGWEKWQRVGLAFTVPADGNGVVDICVLPSAYSGDGVFMVDHFVITDMTGYDGEYELPPNETEITGEPELIQFTLPPLPKYPERPIGFPTPAENSR